MRNQLPPLATKIKSFPKRNQLLSLFSCFLIYAVIMAYYGNEFTTIRPVPNYVLSQCIQARPALDVSHEPLTRDSWHCLPHYLGVGFPKCGSSTLWRYLKQNPKVSLYRHGRTKEAHFFHQPPNIVHRSLHNYLRSFPAITLSTHDEYTVGEHTPGYIWRVPYKCSPHPTRMGCWGDNAGSNISSTAMNIANIIPTVKLLVTLRDPTDRAYSHFWHFSGACYTTAPKRDPKCFHDLAKQQMHVIRQCESNTTGSLSRCAWGDIDSPDAWFMLPRMVSLGLYSSFLLEWSLFFPPRSFCVVALEQLALDRDQEMLFIENCIDIKAKKTPYQDEHINRKGTVTPPMLNSTRNMLDSFYAPYSKLLHMFPFMEHILNSTTCPRWLLV